jgi:hypothetical protein
MFEDRPKVGLSAQGIEGQAAKIDRFGQEKCKVRS